mmetsp:Transcript_25988/g.36850  ORF Transcript_25988/g.36850 Transcript_25988/m.36850 type:complete len:116 (+) Transcript_25988:1069-1416(+)
MCTCSIQNPTLTCAWWLRLSRRSWPTGLNRQNENEPCVLFNVSLFVFFLFFLFLPLIGFSIRLCSDVFIYLFIYFFFLFVVVVETVGIKVTLTQQMRLTRSGRIAAASFLPAANC